MRAREIIVRGNLLKVNAIRWSETRYTKQSSTKSPCKLFGANVERWRVPARCLEQMLNDGEFLQNVSLVSQ